METATAMKKVFRKIKRPCSRENRRQPFISCFRIPGTLEYDGVRLRSLRIADIPPIRNGLLRHDMAEVGPGKSELRSCFAMWWWLKHTYALLYSIEVQSGCGGFVGLYDLKPDGSAEVTLVIFDPGMRRRGYGSTAYALFAEVLRRNSFIKECVVRVKTDNHPALCFWEALGFKVRHATKDMKTLAKDMEEDIPS